MGNCGYEKIVLYEPVSVMLAVESSNMRLRREIGFLIPTVLCPEKISLA